MLLQINAPTRIPKPLESSKDQGLEAPKDSATVTIEEEQQSGSLKSIRKTATFGTDTFFTYQVAKHLMIEDQSGTWITRLFAKAGTSTPAVSTPAAASRTTLLGRLFAPFARAGTRIGQAIPWLGATGRGIARFGGWIKGLMPGLNLGSKTLPVIGGLLAAADVAMDVGKLCNMDGTDDVIKNSLKGIDPVLIEEAQKLAGADLSETKNQEALKKHLLSCGVNEADAAKLTAKLAETQSAVSDQRWQTGINATCTGTGAIIGLCLGGPVGMAIGAGIGNLVGMGINMARKGGLFSGIGKAIGGLFSKGFWNN